MERATGTEVYDGCGSPQSTDITLNITTTTGGSFSISVNGKNTVEHLKKLVSKKLKVSKDRICLLHRERQLRDGTLEENGLLDGARIILLPSVETGLLSQRPENSVMQALESLNDTQVNDFLSGKSPLNLTMRLGDHMMLIQLQLSTLGSGSGARSLRTPTPTKGAATPVRSKCDTRDTINFQPPTPPQAHSGETITNPDKYKARPFMPKHNLSMDQELELLQNAFKLYRTMTEGAEDTSEPCVALEDPVDPSCIAIDMSKKSLDSEQSPIKSLSNLVSSPIDASTSQSEEATESNEENSELIEMLSSTDNVSSDVIPSTSAINEPCPSTSSHTTPDSSLSDDSDNFTEQSSFLTESTIDEYPMENLFNSAVDKGLFQDQCETMMDREISNLATTSYGQESTSGSLPSFQSINEPLKNKRFQYLLHKTSKFKHPIGQSKQKAFMQSVVNKHKKRMQIRQESDLANSTASRTQPYITNTRKLVLQPSPNSIVNPNLILRPNLIPNPNPTPNPTVMDSNETLDLATPSTSKEIPQTSKEIPFKAPETPKKATPPPAPVPDTRALIEASKNLTQKLKKLSKEVLLNKIDLKTAEETVRTKIGPGAVIESMKHHGKGVYSGTFSGTLNPALQDRYGRPKRDISTIIHILNDLLCASPPIALAQKDQKAASTSKCLGCSQPSCALGQCDGHTPSTSAATATSCPSCAAHSSAGDLCAKCSTARAFAMENSKTKCKLEQLRLVMQQKKQRREARKLKTLPYTSPPKITSPEKTPPIQEEIETLA